MRGGGVHHVPHGGRGGKLILGYQHKVVVPSSTQKIIIFPVDQKKGKFNTSLYDPAMTRGRISREEISRFLEELDPMVKPIFNSDMNSFLKCYQAAYPFLFLGVAIVFILTIILGISKGKFHTFFIAAAIFATFWFSIVIVSIINCIHCAGVKRKMEESKTKIMPLIIAKNPEFKRNGYYWVAPHRFPYWLELWVDEAPTQAASMERQYGIPMREEVPYYHPSSNSTQVSPIMYSP